MAFSALEPNILSSLPSYASLACFGLDEEMKSSKGRRILAREDILLRAFGDGDLGCRWWWLVADFFWQPYVVVF